MTHTKNPDLLMVAEMTMKEHGLAQMDLSAAARSQGYSLPTDPGPVNKAFAQKLATPVKKAAMGVAMQKMQAMKMGKV